MSVVIFLSKISARYEVLTRNEIQDHVTEIRTIIILY